MQGYLKKKSNSHGARPVHLIITVIVWIRTSRLSMKNSLSEDERFLGEQTEAAEHTHLVLEALLLGAAPGRFICLQCVWAVTLGALLPEAGSSRTHTSQPLGRAYRSCVIQFHFSGSPHTHAPGPEGSAPWRRTPPAGPACASSPPPPAACEHTFREREQKRERESEREKAREGDARHRTIR